MAAWEYIVIALPPFEAATAESAPSAAVRALNAEGANGWEAVGMTVLSDGGVAVLMKRSGGADVARSDRGVLGRLRSRGADV
ncbi:MAG: hypothetical protein ABSG81_00815 [Acidimicrobiales bacterium]|jgi:hypothetical protein